MSVRSYHRAELFLLAFLLTETNYKRLHALRAHNRIISFRIDIYNCTKLCIHRSRPIEFTLLCFYTHIDE